jgi:hypothetical protein
MEEEKSYITKISLHAARNMLGSQEQTSLFSDHDISKAIRADAELSQLISRFGIDLSDMEFRLVEGILLGFSETNYEGNLPPVESSDEGVDFINLPRLKVTQLQLLKLSGISNSFGPKAKAIEALQSLSEKQYAFYYNRLVYDKNHNPMKDSKNNWIKEEVCTISNLFSIKEVKHPETHILKYYEISPSTIFLDQVDSFFMMIPLGWRDEVKSLVDSKKVSLYLFRFLFFLRYQYEMKRRTKRDKPFTIRWSPEEICIAIKMPESIYNRQKKRANAILEECYTVARKLGYLKNVVREQYVDSLVLNDSKFYNPRAVRFEEQNPVAIEIFNHFHSLRSKIDPSHKSPSGSAKDDQVSEFNKLLSNRSKEDILKVMEWAFFHPFWSVQVMTPHKLVDKFKEVWTAMSVASGKGKEVSAEENKSYAQSHLSKMKIPKGVMLEVLNKAVEVGNGVHQPIVIDYQDKEFKVKLDAALKKWGIIHR